MSRNTAASYLSSTNLVILPLSSLLFHTTYPRCLLIHYVETLHTRSHCFLPHCIHLDQKFGSLGLQYSSNQPVVVRLPQSRRCAFVSCTWAFCHAYSSSLLYSGTPTERQRSGFQVASDWVRPKRTQPRVQSCRYKRSCTSACV